MRYSVLGPVAVGAGDAAPEPVGSRIHRVILAVLLANRHRVVPVDELVDAVWQDDPPASAIPTLRAHVSRLRQTVGDDLVGRPGGYTLDAEAVDADEFELHLRADRCAEALGLWRGRAYGDASDLEAVRSEARRLERLLATARIQHLEHLLASGETAEAAAHAEAVVATDPVAEPAWAVLVRALAAEGRNAEALRACERAREALADAGLVPGTALREAEQDVLAGLEAAPEPPPPAAKPPRPSAPLTSMVGRDAERRRLGELLRSRRLVTIVGPGGVGKTRLAVEVARAVADHHARGAVVVELARVDDAPAVAAAIRRAMSVSDRAAPAGELPEMGDVDALVVLDNCEHLVDTVARLVPQLLAGGDALRILATSREALRIDGEQRWVAAPLETLGASAPAVQLFAQRATDAGVVVDPADPRVHAVVDALDGLPLAIEMAAARLATMGLDDLVDAVRDHVETLGGALRRDEGRQSTLDALFRWSESLLDPAERDALREFSVFAGPVPSTSVDAVLSGPDPVGAVTRLVEQSLVTIDRGGGRARFGMLGTIRTLVRNDLASAGALDDTSRRHAVHVADEVDRAVADLDSDREAAAVETLLGLLDEVRAALSWARGHEPDLAVRIARRLPPFACLGARIEVYEWIASTIELAHDPDDLTALLGAAAYGRTLVLELDDGEREAAEALGTGGSEASSLWAHLALADSAIYRGDLARSAAEAEAAMDRAGHDAGFERAFATATAALARAYGGDVEGAKTLVDAAPTPASPSGRGWLRYTSGEILGDRDPGAAIALLDDAIRLAEGVHSHYLAGVAHVSAASMRLRARHGDPDEAARAFRRTIERFLQRRNRTHLLTTLRNLVDLLVRLGRDPAAAELLGAVHDSATRPTFGAEAERLATADEYLRSMMGDDAYEAARESGRSRSLEEAAAVALTALP